MAPVYPLSARRHVAGRRGEGYEAVVDPATPSAAFEALARRLEREDPPSPGEAALVLAAEFDPRLHEERARARLDGLAREAAACVAPDAPAEERVESLIRFLHEEQGFRGNVERYEDPRNSYLHEVLVRRTGIPITLALVYLELGARSGLPLEGISFPGHFLVRAPGPDLLIDPFYGRVLDDDECTERLRRTLGPQARFDRSALRAARVDEILVRMLGNLKHVFVQRGELAVAVGCCTRILRLAPQAVGEWRDRGLLWEQLECFAAAREDLGRFLALAPRAPDAPAIAERLGALSEKGHLH
jgi:regulator of sirC expression with transglutaminase-like and TPR domain